VTVTVTQPASAAYPNLDTLWMYWPSLPSAVPTSEPDSYLLVTLDQLVLPTVGDNDDAGEIQFGVNVLASGSSFGPGYNVVTTFPAPETRWVEVQKGIGLTVLPEQASPLSVVLGYVPKSRANSLGLPIFMCPWDKSPDSLQMDLAVQDNDQGPQWIPNLLSGASVGLQRLRGAVDKIMNLPLDAGQSAVEAVLQEIFPDQSIGMMAGVASRFVTEAGFWWKSWRDYGIQYFTGIDMAETTSLYSKMLQSINSTWLPCVIPAMSAMTLLADALSLVAIRLDQSNDTIATVSEIASGTEPCRANVWGITDGQSATYTSPDGIAQTTFRRLERSTSPLTVTVRLVKLNLSNDRDYPGLAEGHGDVYINSRAIYDPPRYVEAGDTMHTLSETLRNLVTDPLRRIWTLGARLQAFPEKRTRWPSSTAPAQYYEGVDGGDVDISCSSAMCSLLPGPDYPILFSGDIDLFLYLEVEVNDDDTKKVAEDNADWLGTFSHLYTYSDLVQWISQPHTELCELTSNRYTNGMALTFEVSSKEEP
jgi:hypothetical protein